MTRSAVRAAALLLSALLLSSCAVNLRPAEPVIPDGMRSKIVWVCRDRRSYDDCHRWMEKSGRVCVMELK